MTRHLVEVRTVRLWHAVQLQRPHTLPAGCLPCWPLSPAQRLRAVLRALEFSRQ
jgi:hypothetical protein